MGRINIYHFVWLFSVLIASFSQVLLKVAAGRTYQSRIREYVNPFVITAYGILFMSMLLTMFALWDGHNVNYSSSAIIQSMEYVFIPVLSMLILKEKIGRRKVIGMLFIFAGSLIFAL